MLQLDKVSRKIYNNFLFGFALFISLFVFCLFFIQKSPDLWRFIEALNWINPHMTVSIGSQTSGSSRSIKRIQPPKSSRIRSDKALMWLYENLLTHHLQTKLQCLLSDNEHLTNCYEVTLAFFGSKKFVEALYICLDAFDKKQYDILLQIDQNLYLSVINESLKNSAAAAAATASIVMNDKSVTQKLLMMESSEFCDSKNASKSSLKKCDDSVLNLTNKSTGRKCRNTGRTRCKLKHCISLKLRKFVSLPDLSKESKVYKQPRSTMTRSRSQTICAKSHRMKLTAENLALNDRQKSSSYSLNKRNSTSNRPDQSNGAHGNKSAIDDLQPINLVKCDDIKIHTDRRGELSSNSINDYNVPAKSVGLIKSSNLLPYLNTSHGSSTDSNSPGKKLTSNSAPGDFASFFAANGAKIENRYQRSTLFDNIESSTSSPLCNHDQCALIPNRGQSLTSYLQEAQRTRRNITDLERENAHFNLSDAIISAIEEIKCSRMERQKEKQIKASAQTKRRKAHQRPLKKWILGDDETCDKNNVNVTDDDTSSLLSEENTAEITTMSRTSSSGSDLSHISSSDSSTANDAGDLKRLKVLAIYFLWKNEF